MQYSNRRETFKNQNLFSPQKKSAWREGFKQQCLQQLRTSRDAKLFQNRGISSESISHASTSQSFSSDTRDNLNTWAHTVVSDQIQNLTPDEFSDEILTPEELAQIEAEILEEWNWSVAAEEAEKMEVEELEWVNDAAERYMDETVVCFVCQRGNLVLVDNVIRCNGCGMFVNGEEYGSNPVNDLYQTALSINNQHESVCGGQSLFHFDENTGLLMLCSQCDYCAALG